jgi:hypothetical protein
MAEHGNDVLIVLQADVLAGYNQTDFGQWPISESQFAQLADDFAQTL